MARYGYISASTAAELKAQPIELRKETPRHSPRRTSSATSASSSQHQFGHDATFYGGFGSPPPWTWASSGRRARRRRPPVRARRSVGGRGRDRSRDRRDPRDGRRARRTARARSASSTSPRTVSGVRPGSAFKPFTLASAMEDRISLNSFWNGPSQITITDPRCNNPDGTPWQPSNAADEGAGVPSLIDATAFSVNTIFAQLVTVVGPRRGRRRGPAYGHHARRCSRTVRPRSARSRSIPLDMADAYATLAARGRPPPRDRALAGDPALRGPAPAPDRSRRDRHPGAQPEQRRPGDLRAPARHPVRDRHARRHRAAGRREDGHRAGLPRRLVLRVHPATGGLRLGGLPEEREHLAWSTWRGSRRCSAAPSPR